MRLSSTIILSASRAGLVPAAHALDLTTDGSWFGLTPKAYSSGNSRYLGRISKKGDHYLRMLLTQGVRSVLRAAKVA